MASRIKKEVPVADREVLDASGLEAFEIWARLEALALIPINRPKAARSSRMRFVPTSWRSESSKTQAPRAHFGFAFRIMQRAEIERRWVHRESDGREGGRPGRLLKQIEKAALRDGGVRADDKASLHLQSIAKFMWPVRGQGDEINYEARIHDALRDGVRKFHPIAHLVAAYQFAGRCADAEGLRMEFDYDNLPFYRAIVMLAATFASYIRDTPELMRAAAQ